jgi:hypothetical protein
MTSFFPGEIDFLSKRPNNLKFMNRTILFFPALVGFLMLSFMNCSENVPNYPLELTSFRLNVPNLELDKYFQRVVGLEITDQGEFIMTDGNRLGVFIFDQNGNYVDNLANYGNEGYEFVNSVSPVDTLLAVNFLRSLEFLTKKGHLIKRHFLRGRGKTDVAADGAFLINRMYDARLLGHCLETYDPDGKSIATFRTPRSTQEGTEILDFGFSQIAPDNKIIYVPAAIDSGFVYDFQGNLLLTKKLKSSLKPYKLADGAPGALVEDMFVNEDGIFLIRLNPKLSNEEMVFFDLIEHYNFNFDRVATYSFAVPLTITVPVLEYAPWYHKFAYKNGIFYFVVSQPFEQLLAFKIKN